MLKVCWDCIAGSSRDTENTYHPTRNENFHSVQWTSRNPGNMFRLPRPMKYNDSIEIMAEIQRRESIMFTICHENSSPAGQIEVNFIDKCTYEYKDGNKNVISDVDPADIFTETNFTLSLKVENQTDDGEYVLGVSIEPSYDLYSFNVNNILSLSYLEISNDVSVKKLCFKY